MPWDKTPVFLLWHFSHSLWWIGCMPFSQYNQDSDPFWDAVHLPATSRAWPKPLPDGTTKYAVLT